MLRAITYGLAVLGVIVLWLLAASVIAGSGFLNWRFGFDFIGATDPIKQHVIAGVLVALDVFKASLPIVIGLMWIKGKWAPLRCCALVFLAGISAWAAFEVNRQGRADIAAVADEFV